MYILGALAVYLLISLLTYSAQDPGWSNSGTGGPVQNLGGSFGAWFADVFLQIFGYMAYLFPFMAGWAAWRLFVNRGPQPQPELRHKILLAVGFFLTVVGGCGLENLHFAQLTADKPFVAGGFIGSSLSEAFAPVFGGLGTTLLTLAMFLAGFTLLTSLSWLWLMDITGKYTLDLYRLLKRLSAMINDHVAGMKARNTRQDTVKELRKRMKREKPPRIEPRIREQTDSGRLERERQVNLFETPATGVRPPLSLLDPVQEKTGGFSTQSLESMSRLVEKKLRDFSIEAQVVEVHPGPVITRFEIDPAPGIKSSQIGALANDLARALSVVSVRVVENIPGKTHVGLEIPNETRETIQLLEGLSSQAFEEANTPLPLMLGKDIGGGPVIADMCKMPHLLIGGTTGSGKSVCINALVLSMIYKSTPEDVRLIMIDPKMLELSVYDGIPHLLTPVVTDMSQAANALRWCIEEMERRFRLMAALSVRNIAGYNRKVTAAKKERRPLMNPLLEPDQEPEELRPYPYIVVVIDELADLMMVAGKKVEELIARIAQRARAAGIHLILATQRPSVDVITGLIKANIPARIAFQVSARVDSRTILDQIGAEHLLGQGDMLYLPPGTAAAIRVHGAFVSDQEVQKIAKHLKKGGKPEYHDEILEGPDESAGSAGASDGGGETDPLYDEALRLVTETRRASISAVQRRLRIGYNRAARMIEAMEAAGVVGPLQSNGKREVLAPPPPK